MSGSFDLEALDACIASSDLRDREAAPHILATHEHLPECLRLDLDWEEERRPEIKINVGPLAEAIWALLALKHTKPHLVLEEDYWSRIEGLLGEKTQDHDRFTYRLLNT